MSTAPATAVFSTVFSTIVFPSATMRRLLTLATLATCSATLLGASSASAQIALPGAVAPSPEGTLATPSGVKKKKLSSEIGQARGPAVMPKAPSEDTVVGKSLKLDGNGSAVEFARAGAELQVAKLSLSGDRLSRSGEACRVEVAGTPLKLTPQNGGSGLRRYQISFAACPFTLDILDGAILVTNDGKACEIKEADCRADPSGLWGTPESDLDPKKAEEMLGARARVEKTVRGDFRELYDRNKKDKLVRGFVVKEQAGFSSWREEVCRTYGKESEFGYCALRLTEARAIVLGAQIASGVKLPDGYAEAAAAEESAAKAKGKK
jgi:hypothetical protein